MEDNQPIEYYLRSTWLSVVKMYNEKAATYDSSMVFGFTLLSIDPKKGTPSTALGPKMGIESTSLSRTLKNLEDRGLIYREDNPDDGRSIIIKLTDDGLKMRDISKKNVLEFNNEIADTIPKEKLDIFIEVMNNINKITNKKEIINQN